MLALQYYLIYILKDKFTQFPAACFIEFIKNAHRTTFEKIAQFSWTCFRCISIQRMCAGCERGGRVAETDGMHHRSISHSTKPNQPLKLSQFLNQLQSSSKISKLYLSNKTFSSGQVFVGGLISKDVKLDFYLG